MGGGSPCLGSQWVFDQDQGTWRAHAPASQCHPLTSMPAVAPPMQPQLVVGSEGYRAGQTALALTQAFLAVDELLVLPEHRDELKALRGGEKDEKRTT